MHVQDVFIGLLCGKDMVAILSVKNLSPPSRPTCIKRMVRQLDVPRADAQTGEQTFALAAAPLPLSSGKTGHLHF